MYIFKLVFVAVTLAGYMVSLPADLDCAGCSPEECAENAAISCCKSCLAQIKCTPKEMIVSVPRSIARLALEDLSFADADCGGTLNGTRYIFKTAVNKCGTRRIFIRRTHILYKNEIRQKNGRPLYSLTCLFKRKANPVRKNVKVKTEKNKFTKMYHTSAHGRRKYGKQTYLEDSDEQLFFEIKGPSYLRDRDMQMAVKTCRLDITQNSNVPGDNPISDLLINNGCPTRPEVVPVMQNWYTLWFSVKLNDVQQNRNDTAVLNCDVVLCPNAYNKRCQFKC